MIEKFETEINNFKNNEAMRQAIEALLDDCKQHAEWCRDIKRNEDGTYINDEKGNYIYEEPEEGSYKYMLMEAYLKLAKIIAKAV